MAFIVVAAAAAAPKIVVVVVLFFDLVFVFETWLKHAARQWY